MPDGGYIHGEMDIEMDIMMLLLNLVV